MADPILDAPIPDTPPKGSSPKPNLAMKSIALIKKHCVEGGLTSKYAQCAILAVIGGECGWLPVREGFPHSKDFLINVMHRSPEDAAKYGKGGQTHTREEYFGWLYGSSFHPPHAVSDGANYYGRGFIQLTFKSNYERYGKLIGIDLVNNPDILYGEADENLEANAKYVVAYMKDRIKNWQQKQHSSGFMEDVLKAVGGVKTGWPKKRGYFEYFLGGKAAPAPTDKDPATPTVNKTAKEISTAPAHKKEAYTEPRDENFDKNGFTDPEGKYPLRDYMNEPDTNRLARGILKGTHIEFKDQNRHTGIPTANGGTYDQPRAGYSSVYPHNKVFESESGHVLEFDDSPNGERVNLYHKKGTFIEIDANGTQVNHIIGDGYYIVERNGNIFVNGTCNITTAGNVNLLCEGDANVEVNGRSDIVLHNEANLGVALDLNIAVGGDMNVLVEGNYNLEVGKTFNTRTIGTMSLESTDALKLKTAKSISMEGGDTQSTAETLMKLSGDIKIETDGAYQIKAKSIQFDTTETLKLNSGGQLSAKGTKINLNDPDETITPLEKLGAKKKPTDFKGDTIPGRQEEHVLVETVLNPAGTYNPNTVSETVVDSILNNIPLSDDLKGLFGGSAPNIYDKKYAGEPVENKTSLSAAGKTNGRLRVPSVDSAHDTPHDNLPSPDRISEMRYDTEEEWSSPKGSKTAATENATEASKYELANRPPSDNTTTDGEGNVITAGPLSGGSNSTKSVSGDKLAEINSKNEFPKSYQLSKHFTLGMLIKDNNVLRDQMLPGGKSEKAGTPTRMYTKQELVANLAALCENCLEPIYDLLGPSKEMDNNGTWTITSGLRNPGNVASSGDGSDHNKGRACDFHLMPKKSISEMYALVLKLEKLLPYNQLIFEYRNGGASNWIHVSYSTQGNQKRAFTMVNDKPVNASGQPASGSTGLFKFFAKD